MSGGRNTGTVPKTKHNSRPRRENPVNHIPNNLDWNPEYPPQRTRKESNTYASNLSDGATMDYSMSFLESNPWVAQALAPTNRTDDDELRWSNVKTNNIHPERSMCDPHHGGPRSGGVMHRQDNNPSDDKEGVGSREILKKKMELSQKKIEELKQKQAALISLRNKTIHQVKPVQMEELQSHGPLTLRNKVAHEVKPVQLDLDKLGNLSERLQNVQEFANAIQALERDENMEANEAHVERIRNRLSELLAKKAQYDNLLSCLEDEHMADVAPSLSSEEGELLQCPRYRGSGGGPPLTLDSFLDEDLGAVGGAGVSGGRQMVDGPEMTSGPSSSHQAKQDNRELVDQVAQSAAFINNKELRLEEVKNKLEQLQSLLSRVERLGQTKTQSDIHQHQEQVQAKNCPTSSVMEKLHTKKIDLDQDVRKAKVYPQNPGYRHFQQQNVENWAKGINGPVITEYSSDEGEVDYDESPVKLCSTSRVPSNSFQKGRHNVAQMVNNTVKSPHTTSTSGLRRVDRVGGGAAGGGGVTSPLVGNGVATDLSGGGDSMSGLEAPSRIHHRSNGRPQPPPPLPPVGPPRGPGGGPGGGGGGNGGGCGVHEELLQSSPNYASLAIQINQLQLQMEQLQYQSVLEKQQMPNFAPPLPPSTSGPPGSCLGHQHPLGFVQYTGGSGSQWHQHQLLVNSLNQCCQLAIANWHQQRELAALRQALAMLQEESNMYKCGGYGNNLNFDSGLLWTQTSPQTLNNQVAPGNRANNYWDNFRSYSRQNLLSGRNKSNEGSIAESIPSAPRPPASQMDNLRRKDNSESNSSAAPQPSTSSAPLFTPPRLRRPFSGPHANGEHSKHRQSELFALEQSIYSEFDTVISEANRDPQLLLQLLSQLKNIRVVHPPSNYEEPAPPVNGVVGELDALADANVDAVMVTITRLVERQQDTEPICTPEFLATVVDSVTTLVKYRTLQNGGTGSDMRSQHSLATRLEASLLRFQGCRLDLVSDELLFDVARIVTSGSTPTGRPQPVENIQPRQNHHSMELAVTSSSQQFNASVQHEEEEEEEGAVGGVPLSSMNHTHRSIETELAEADQTQHNSMDNVVLFGLEDLGVLMDNQEMPPREDALDQMCSFPEGAVGGAANSGGGRPSSRN